MRLVKKVTAAAMASAMALSLAACGGEEHRYNSSSY